MSRPVNHRVTSSNRRQAQRARQYGRMPRSLLGALIVCALGLLAITQREAVQNTASKIHDRAIAWSADRGFVVARVDVVGRNRVTPQFMIQALKVTRGMPVFAYCPKEAQERLSENPWLKAAYVERRLPDTIFVRLDERKPVARWQVNGKLAVIDAEGVVLTTENMPGFSSLPLVIGPEARHKVPDLFALLRSEPEIGRQVAAATWVGNRRWDLTLKNGMVVKLPAADAGLALAKLASLEKGKQILARDLVSVDLRLPQKAILMPTIRANALIERPDFSDTPDAGKKNI